MVSSFFAVRRTMQGVTVVPAASAYAFSRFFARSGTVTLALACRMDVPRARARACSYTFPKLHIYTLADPSGNAGTQGRSRCGFGNIAWGQKGSSGNVYGHA